MSLSLAAGILAAWGLVQRKARPRSGLLIAALMLGLAAATLALQFGASRPVLITAGFGNSVMWGVLNAVAGLVLAALLTALVFAPRLPTFLFAAWLVWIAWPLATLPLPLRSVGSAAALVAMGLLGWAALVRARPGRVLVAIDRLLDPAQRAGWRPSSEWAPTAWVIAAVIGAVLALAVPHLVTVLGGSLLAALAGATAWRAPGRMAWGLLIPLIVLPLMLLWSLHLSGPLGGWIPNLIDGPFSPRAAQHLGLLSLLSTVALAGLWPLHGITVPVLLAPAAIAVGGTFATLLVPDGVQWWQPLAAPMALVAMAHALARRLPAQFLMAAGVFGLWTGTRAGALGGAMLVMSAWALVLVPGSWVARLPVTPVAARLLWLPAVVGAVAILHGGLATEVVYTLAAVAIGAAGILILSDEGASLVDPRP